MEAIRVVSDTGVNVNCAGLLGNLETAYVRQTRAEGIDGEERLQHMPLAALSLSCGGDWGEAGTNVPVSHAHGRGHGAAFPEEQGQVDLGDIHTGLEEIIARAD